MKCRTLLTLLALLVPLAPAEASLPEDAGWSADYANPIYGPWESYPFLISRDPGSSTPAALYAGATYDGDLIVGGNLSQDNLGNPTPGVARWDGTAWQPLGGGINGDVYALCVWGGDLFAGGNFDSAGSAASSDIAYWDGASWHSVPGTSSGSIRELAVFDGALIACGAFSEIGGVPAAGIAAWNGATWSALGSGLGDSPGRALWVDAGVLHVGGDFTTAGGGPGDYVATWNGASWSAIPGGPNGPVHALTTWQGELVAGGEFTAVGGASGSIVQVARFDGSSWSLVGDGFEDSSSSPYPVVVRSLAGDAAYLVACGDFEYSGAEYLAGGAARWTGAKWERMGEDRHRNRLFYHDGYLHCVGYDNGVWPQPTARFWPYSSLRPLGFRYPPGKGVEFQGSLHLGVSKGCAWCSTPGDVARFTGDGWTDLGLGEEPGALYVWNDLLVAAADLPAQVQTWDGTAWTAMDAGLPAGTVPQVFQDYGGVLYCGLSDSASPANYLWRWNGALWETVPGAEVSGPITAMAEFNGELYFTGLFGTVGGIFMRRIAAWNGTSARKLGAGLESGVANALQVFGGNLIVGGDFGSAGPVVAQGLAGYDGSSWFALGDVLSTRSSSPEIEAFAVYNQRLIAAGDFTSVAGVDGSGVIAYDGATWSPLGSGVNPVGNSGPATIFDAVSAEGSLWLTGYILFAGCERSSDIARWTDAITGVPLPDVARMPLPPASPNPFRSATRLELALERPSHVQARVLDVRGRLVRTLIDGFITEGTLRITWDGRLDNGIAASPGVYFLDLSREGQRGSQRLVRLR